MWFGDEHRGEKGGDVREELVTMSERKGAET